MSRVIYYMDLLALVYVFAMETQVRFTNTEQTACLTRYTIGYFYIMT